jgi:putative transposase
LYSVKTYLQKFFTMSKKSNYTTTNRSKHYLKIHLIFVCKYRKPLLIGNLNEDMKTILKHKTTFHPTN